MEVFRLTIPKYSSLLAINNLLGSSISSQRCFSPFFYVISPLPCVGWACTFWLRRHSEKGFVVSKAESGKKNWASQLLATLRFDTCPVMWQNLQTGYSLHKLTVHDSARGPGAKQPKQQSERLMEATGDHLEEDCTSLEPAGQATLEKRPFPRPKALIPWVKLLCIVEMTTESYSHVRTNSSWHQGMSAQRLHIHNHTFTTTCSLRAPSLTHVFLRAVLQLC